MDGSSRVEYATALFRPETLEGVMDAYFDILRQVCREPDVARGGGVASVSLEVVEEGEHQRRVDVLQDQSQALRIAGHLVPAQGRGTVLAIAGVALRDRLAVIECRA